MLTWIDIGPRCKRLTRTGRHKVCYRSELAAMMVAARLENQVGERFPYQCPVCEWWHLTKRKSNMDSADARNAAGGYWCQNCSRVMVDVQGAMCEACKALIGQRLDVRQVEKDTSATQVVVDAIMRAIMEVHTGEFQEAWQSLPAELRNDNFIEATAILDCQRRKLQRAMIENPLMEMTVRDD